MTEFTRYLYLKEEVEVAMLMSLLHGDKERALFWAYELYYSGLVDGLLLSLWRIYYEFYAMLNPALETYLKKKQTEIASKEETGHFVGIFVHNLLIRKYTLDVFMLREVSVNIELDEADAKLSLEERFSNNNYEAIAHAMFDACTSVEDCEPIVAVATTYFKSQGIKNPKLLKDLRVEGLHPAIVLMSRIMHYYADLNKNKNNIKMGKNLYLVVEPEEMNAYKTIKAKYDLSPNKILQKAVIYSPIDHGYNYVHLFRNDYTRSATILDDYRSNWLYYAAKSTPIWKERLAEYGGQVDEETGWIRWGDDDGEELFYEAYGYDPEEQPVEVFYRNIPPMEPSKNITWRAFYNKLADSRPRLYTPHPDILEALE